MQYNLDANGYIANCAIVGSVENGVTYAAELPQGFWDFPQAYRLVDGVLTLDAARRDALTAAAQAEADAPADDPTAALERRIAELEAVIDALIGGAA